MKEFNIENCPDKHYYVEFLVLKNFIAAIKKRGMYFYFRASVGANTNNCVSRMYRSFPSFQSVIRSESKDNIFKEASNITAFLKIMVESFGGKCGADFAGKDNGALQHHIANCTNMLVHIFVERFRRDFNFLSEVGGDTFNSTCSEIFGNDFTDLTDTAPEMKEEIEKIQEMMSAGERPSLSPQLMERLKRAIEQNRRIYGEDFFSFDDNEEGIQYDEEEDYNFFDDEESPF